MSGVREEKGGGVGESRLLKLRFSPPSPSVYFINTVGCDRIFQTILSGEHRKLRD